VTDLLTIAVTGATGFLGDHMIRRLRAVGHRVRALSRQPMRADPDNALTWVRGDLTDTAALNALVEGADVVVHAAGAIKALSRAEFFRVNRDGTLAVARAAAEQGVSRLVFVSSLAAREPALSPYAASKRAAELALADYTSRIDTVILRPPAIYGPGDQETARLFQMAVNGFILAPGDSSARMSLIHVGDVATAIQACCERDQPGRPLEIDDGAVDGHSWRDLAEAAGRAAGRRTKLVYLPNILVWAMGGVGTAKGLITQSPAMLTLAKVPELLHPNWVSDGPRPHGWAPQWTLEEGVHDAIDWYSSQNVLKRYF
jgi:2-alkyl-3-oxoalkanoate reductase